MFDVAALLFEEIAPEDKNRTEVLGMRVQLYMAAKKWDMAAAVASHLVKVEPENEVWWHSTWPVTRASPESSLSGNCGRELASDEGSVSGETSETLTNTMTMTENSDSLLFTSCRNSARVQNGKFVSECLTNCACARQTSTGKTSNFFEDMFLSASSLCLLSRMLLKIGTTFASILVDPLRLG
jgi:hypothetical protein